MSNKQQKTYFIKINIKFDSIFFSIFSFFFSIFSIFHGLVNNLINSFNINIISLKKSNYIIFEIAIFAKCACAWYVKIMHEENFCCACCVQIIQNKKQLRRTNFHELFKLDSNLFFCFFIYCGSL